MSIMNQGNPVSWGIKGQTWHVIGEFGDYFILLLQNYNESMYEGDTRYLPLAWESCWMLLHLISYGNNDFSDEEKSFMMYETVYPNSDSDPHKCYATLLTAQQVDSMLPIGSSIRGENWWIKKPMISETWEKDIVVKSSGLGGWSIDCDCGFRPVIGVKKSVLRSMYPNIDAKDSVQSYSCNSSTISTSGRESIIPHVYLNDEKKRNIVSSVLMVACALIAIISTSNWIHLLFMPGWFIIFRFLLGFLGIIESNDDIDDYESMIPFMALFLGFMVGVIAWIFSSLNTGLTWAYYTCSIIADVAGVRFIFDRTSDILF